MGTEEKNIVFENIIKYNIKDKSDHSLGCSINIKDQNGLAIFLPPSSKLTGRESIDKLLESLGKSSTEEKIPDWADKISLPKIEEIESNIQKFVSQRNNLQGTIEQLELDKKEILNHRRLLFSKDPPLEDAVKDAFILLGFNEIRRIRESDKEDWIFEFKHEKQFKYGVIEVKGADNRTKQEHIVQASKWVDERFAIDKKVSKGIFIPNQHRKKEYPKSKKDRTHFEPNELDYAKMKSICIIPSFVLFETIKDVLDGKKKYRKDIEKLIATSNSVLIKL